MRMLFVYKVYSTMEDSFTVYRGVTPGHNPNGMSWTTDFEKASWFANRFGSGYVIEGTVSKQDVLAYFGNRNEEEYVIEAENVKNKKKYQQKKFHKKKKRACYSLFFVCIAMLWYNTL